MIRATWKRKIADAGFRNTCWTNNIPLEDINFEDGRLTLNPLNLTFENPEQASFLISSHYKPIRDICKKGELELELAQSGFLGHWNNLHSYFTEPSDFYMLREIFTYGFYDFFLPEDEAFIFVDVGMNIGLSSLCILNRFKNAKSYSYEPSKSTFEKSKANFLLNPHLKERAKLFQWGLGNKERSEKIYFTQSGSPSASIYHNFQSEDDLESTKLQSEQILIKQSSTIIQNILDAENPPKLILKLDCEGAEYEILQDLSQHRLLGHIDALLLEWHEFGNKKRKYLTELLHREHFSIFGPDLYNHSKNAGNLFAANTKRS